MSEQNKSDEKSSLATPGIAIVAILLSLFAAQESILKSNRPPTIDSESTVSEDVRSRLWQDPFQAVEEHRKQHRKTQNASINLTTPEEISFHNQPDGHAKITFKNARNDDDGKNALILFPELSDQFGYEYNHGPIFPVLSELRSCIISASLKSSFSDALSQEFILSIFSFSGATFSFSIRLPVVTR